MLIQFQFLMVIINSFSDNFLSNWKIKLADSKRIRERNILAVHVYTDFISRRDCQSWWN